MVAPIIAAKAAGAAKTALTGDIFTQRWQKTVGSGKSKVVVDRELRVNAVTLAVAATAAGAAVLTIGLAGWLMQKKPAARRGTIDGKYVGPRLVRQWAFTAATSSVVVDVPAHYEDHISIIGTDDGPVEKVRQVWVEATYKTVYTDPFWTVYDVRGVKLWTVPGATRAYYQALTNRERGLGWAFLEEKTVGGRYITTYQNPNKYKIGTDDRPGFKVDIL